MKKSILVSSFFLVVIVCFLWLVFKPIDKKTNNQEDLKPDQATTLNIGSIKPSNGFIPIAVDAFGGNIYCELSFDTNQTFVLDNMTKDCFDKLLKNNPTESDPTNFGLNFFNKLLVDPAQSIVKDLWIRYVKYTDQVILTHKAHSKNQANYKNAKRLVDAIRSIRERFFTPFEIKALFGASDKIEDYELVVLKINDSTGMTDDEIEQELNTAINNLPEKSRKAIKFNKDFNDVSRKVQEIKNRGGSQEEIRKERLKVFGPEVTERMESVDKSRAQFKNQAEIYMQKRGEILRRDLNMLDQEKSIEALRKEIFSDRYDKRRIISLEKIYDTEKSLDILN